MIIRVVQMTFREAEVASFLALFEARKRDIRHFKGCLHLELWRDAHNPAVFFTYSHWENEPALDHYRFSLFFRETWSLTKALFALPPQAWSIGQSSLVA